MKDPADQMAHEACDTWACADDELAPDVDSLLKDEPDDEHS